jgi:glycosyltransferase involved in cell wall biosynthesis
MKGKQVWVINQFAGTPVSGWGERHYFLSKKWLREGYRVTIISGSFNHMFNHFPPTPSTYNMDDYEGTSFCWIKTPKYNPKSVLRFWSMIVFAIKALFLPVSKVGKPDVIIVSSMPIFPILSGVILKNRYKAKLIFEVRDLWPLTPIYLMGFSRKHPMIFLMSWLEKLGYRKSDYNVSVLPNSANYINEISGDPQKFKYIPNGISEELLQNEKLPQEIEQLLPKNKFTVGYTGTINLANALEYLVEAANQLADFDEIRIIIVGDGYSKEELKKRNIEVGNVCFIPRIKKSQVQAMIQSFDVCFIGRNNTTLFDHGVSSNKYFDYMLASKPVLVSSNRIKDPVELSGCGIIVPPESGAAIKEGILKLYNMTSDERANMGNKGRVFVKEHHDFEHLSDLYAQLF